MPKGVTRLKDVEIEKTLIEIFKLFKNTVFDDCKTELFIID